MGRGLGVLALLLVLVAAGAFVVSSLSQWGQEAPPVPEPISPPLLQGRVRVEVFNGGGKEGVAREATGTLREMGFDVVYYGNAETFTQDSSVVLDRVGQLEAARWAADALGIREVRSAPDSSRFVEMTVRLGPDWVSPAAEVEDTDAPPPWWDLRRFFSPEDSTESGDPSGL